MNDSGGWWRWWMIVEMTDAGDNSADSLDGEPLAGDLWPPSSWLSLLV